MPKKVFDSLKSKLATTRLQSLVNKVNRVRKAKVKGTKSHKRSQLNQTIVTRGQLFKGARIGVIAIVVIVLLFVALIVFKVVGGINISPSVLSDGTTGAAIIGEQTNILLVGYDSNDSYSFVDFMAVLSLDTNDTKQRMIILNPDFTTSYLDGKNIKFRNVLNNALIQKKSPMETLEKTVEVMLGMHMDRYIAADVSKLPETLQAMGIVYIAPEGVIDADAGEFRDNQLVQGASIVKYLAADEPGQNQKMQRLGKFFKAELEANTNPWRLLGMVLNPDPWTKLISTNATKLELLGWALSMVGKTSVQYIFLTTSDGIYHADLTGGYYVPSTLQVDQRIQDNFARSPVIKEQGRIEIYNATVTPGLANVTKRFLTNQGATVIRTGNYSDKLDRSKLYVPHPENFVNTVNFIKEQMRGKLIIVNEDYPFNHTGDMVLVVGNDAVN